MTKLDFLLKAPNDCNSDCSFNPKLESKVVCSKCYKYILDNNTKATLEKMIVFSEDMKC